MWHIQSCLKITYKDNHLLYSLPFGNNHKTQKKKPYSIIFAKQKFYKQINPQLTTAILS